MIRFEKSADYHQIDECPTTPFYPVKSYFHNINMNILGTQEQDLDQPLG